MKKIIIITTVPISLETLIKGQPKYLSQFFEVKLVTSEGCNNELIVDYEGVELYPINMTRKITIIKDLISLIKLFFFILKEKPDIVYTFTPKAGLLGMISSFFSRVPIRIHNIVGMPLMVATGKRKILLKFIEKLTYFFSTKLFCNSFGLKVFIHDNLTQKQIKVIGQGSINGVDTNFFENNFSSAEKKTIRKKLDIDENDFVLTFVGRIVRDKGVNELIEAVEELKNVHTNLKLLLVGDYDTNLNPIEKENYNIIMTSQNIITVGFQKDIREFLGISDAFVLPSYREGLPNSLIEAGSFGIPLIASNINGCNEIIINKQTGLLVNQKDTLDLQRAINELITNSELYDAIKENVRESMINRFSQDYFWKEMENEFKSNFR